MKRLLTITALSTVLATSAFAASQAEMGAISRYYPEANFSQLTDEQVVEMFAVAQSGASDSEKATQIENIANVEMHSQGYAPSEAAINAITRHYPEADFSALTKSQVDQMFAVTQSGVSDTEKTQEIREIAAADNPENAPLTEMALSDILPQWRIDEMSEAERSDVIALVQPGATPEETRVQLVESMSTATPNLTNAEVQKVRDLLPEADLSVLTTKQIETIRAAIYAGDEDSETRSLLRTALS